MLATQRWLHLGQGALFDLGSHLPPEIRGHLKRKEIALWLALPEQGRPGVPTDLAEKMTDALAPSWPELRLAQGQHTVAARALMEASSWVARRGLPAVVLAIDTPYDWETLSWLESRDLLHGARKAYQGQARANPYGRIPGEGAAALVLAPANDPLAWCQLLGGATTQEPLNSGNKDQFIGAGLSAAARRSLELAQIPAQSITHLVDDANSDPERAKAFSMTVTRLAEYLADGWQRSTPAQATGDLLSAALATHMAIIAWRMRHSPAFGDSTALLLCSSDDDEQVAIVLKSARR